MDDGLHFVGVLDAGTAHADLMFACCVFVPGRILLLLFFASPFFLPVIAPLGFCLVLPAPFVGIVGPYFDFLLVLVVGYLLLLLLSVGGHGLLSLGSGAPLVLGPWLVTACGCSAQMIFSSRVSWCCLPWLCTLWS